MPAQHILAVDDEADVPKLYQRLLRQEIRRGEYHLLFARDGQEALNILDEHPEISVVLLDINMPGMDGLAFLGRINQQSYIDQQYQFVKVVMVTAYGDMTNIRRSFNFGAFDFIMKPFEKPDMLNTINKAIFEAGKIRDLHDRYKSEEQRRIEAERKLGEIEAILQPAFGRGMNYATNF